MKFHTLTIAEESGDSSFFAAKCILSQQDFKHNFIESLSFSCAVILSARGLESVAQCLCPKIINVLVVDHFFQDSHKSLDSIFFKNCFSDL